MQKNIALTATLMTLSFLGASGLVDPELVKGVLSDTFAGRPKIVALNEVCLTKGFEIGRTFAPALAAK